MAEAQNDAYSSSKEERSNIMKVLKASAVKNLGYNLKGKKSTDPKVLHLLSIQKD